MLARTGRALGRRWGCGQGLFWGQEWGTCDVFPGPGVKVKPEGAQEEGKSLQFWCFLHCWSHRWIWSQPRASRAGTPELKYSRALRCCV